MLEGTIVVWSGCWPPTVIAYVPLGMIHLLSFVQTCNCSGSIINVSYRKKFTKNPLKSKIAYYVCTNDWRHEMKCLYYECRSYYYCMVHVYTHTATVCPFLIKFLLILTSCMFGASGTLSHIIYTCVTYMYIKTNHCAS